MGEALIVILSPIMHSEPRFWKSVVNMVAYSWRHGIQIEEMGITERQVVDWARNNLADAALAQMGYHSGKPYTHFLWLDSDHVFNPDLAERLLSHNVDMVSALYFGREAPYLPVVYVKDDTPDPFKHFPLVGVPGGLFEADAVGFGALLMRREVFERVPKPWFTIDYRAGEDIAFCVKAREHGVTIHCDGAYKLGHIAGPPIITEETYRQYLKDNPEAFADRVKVGLNRGERHGTHR